MKQTLHLILEDIDYFDTLDVEKAEEVAKKMDGQIYSWKSTGRWNWLERGYKLVDVGGLVVLPRLLPDSIDMADDVLEEDDIDNSMS